MVTGSAADRTAEPLSKVCSVAWQQRSVDSRVPPGAGMWNIPRPRGPAMRKISHSRAQQRGKVRGRVAESRVTGRRRPVNGRSRLRILAGRLSSSYVG